MKPLGRKTKALALCVIAIAVATFFWPMVVLNTPLLGRTQWSPYQIAQGIWEHRLPVHGGHLEWELIEIGVIYALLPLVLTVLVLFVNQTRGLRIISGIGVIPSFLAKFWHHAFLFTFGWQYFETGHMQRGPTWWILPWVMPALLLISFLDLDTSDASQPRQANRSVIA